MTDWLRRRIDDLFGRLGWRLVRIDKQLAATAQVIAAAPEASEAAKANAMVIMAALRERRPICHWCFNPFDPKPRAFADEVRLRAVLMIPDATPDPLICDHCFASAVGSYNGRATVVGTRNDGPANIALHQLS